MRGYRVTVRATGQQFPGGHEETWDVCFLLPHGACTYVDLEAVDARDAKTFALTMAEYTLRTGGHPFSELRVSRIEPLWKDSDGHLVQWSGKPEPNREEW